jgi:epoxyqueuosine reductase
MLISRRHGNWLLLAAILTRVELAPDEPIGRNSKIEIRKSKIPSACSAANARAASTRARRTRFPRPGVVDARRCISYQTIENKGVIPRELRAGIGAHLRLRRVPRGVPVEPLCARRAGGCCWRRGTISRS